MKRVSYFTFLMLALLVGACFTACDDDDDKEKVESILPMGIRAIDRIVYQTSYHENVFSYEYDASGTKVSSITVDDIDPEDSEVYFKTIFDVSNLYGDNREGTLTITEHSENNEMSITLSARTNEQGLISSVMGQDEFPLSITFEYDTDGYLTKMASEIPVEKVKTRWSSGSVVQLTYAEGSLTSGYMYGMNFTFENSPNKNTNGILCPIVFQGLSVMGPLYYTGLIGKPTKYLIKTAKATSEECTFDYSTEGNADIVTCHAKGYDDEEEYAVFRFEYK